MALRVIKHDRGGDEGLFCFVTFAAQPWGSLVLTKRLEVKKNVVVHLRASDRFAF